MTEKEIEELQIKRQSKQKFQQRFFYLSEPWIFFRSCFKSLDGLYQLSKKISKIFSTSQTNIIYNSKIEYYTFYYMLLTFFTQ